MMDHMKCVSPGYRFAVPRCILPDRLVAGPFPLCLLNIRERDNLKFDFFEGKGHIKEVMSLRTTFLLEEDYPV
jgi:hypothetical protein